VQTRSGTADGYPFESRGGTTRRERGRRASGIRRSIGRFIRRNVAVETTIGGRLRTESRRATLLPPGSHLGSRTWGGGWLTRVGGREPRGKRRVLDSSALPSTNPATQRRLCSSPLGGQLEGPNTFQDASQFWARGQTRSSISVQERRPSHDFLAPIRPGTSCWFMRLVGRFGLEVDLLILARGFNAAMVQDPET
jgi:hypothetical protein